MPDEVGMILLSLVVHVNMESESVSAVATAPLEIGRGSDEEGGADRLAEAALAALQALRG